MSFDVDTEVVVAECFSCGSGLDPGHVHAAHRELVEDPQQGAGLVLVDEQAQRGLVRSGGRRYRSGFTDDDEPGSGIGGVCDLVGENVESVNVGGDLLRDGAVERDRLLEQRSGRRGGGHSGDDRCLGQVLGEPPSHLGLGVRMGRNTRYLVKGGSWSNHQRELHRQHNFVNDDEALTAAEFIQRGGDRSFDRVLDRNECVIHGVAAHRFKRGGHGGRGQ